MSLSIKDARIFSNARSSPKTWKKPERNCIWRRQPVRSFWIFLYPLKRIWNAAAVPQVLRIFIISAGLWIFPQMTVFFWKTARKQILHTMNYWDCFPCVMKAAWRFLPLPRPLLSTKNKIHQLNHPERQKNITRLIFAVGLYSILWISVWCMWKIDGLSFCSTNYDITVCSPSLTLNLCSLLLSIKFELLHW